MDTSGIRHRRLLAPLVGALALAAAVVLSVVAPADSAQVGPARTTGTAAHVPPIRHVFVVNIENKGYAETWGRHSKAPYLAKTLRRKGVLLNHYYATAHNSQPNYVAQISGQGPNPEMQGDCQIYSAFTQTGTQAPQQATGRGCVFPKGVNSLPAQLTRHHLRWKGYMEDMTRPCQHPRLNTRDHTQHATAQHEYATRHDPFMYFRWITSRPKYCARHVVTLGHLRTALKTAASTPNLVYITPDLCNDGHDSPCANGRAGGLAAVNTWMKRWVPRILASPAYRRNGMLVITADESDGARSDSTACCGEGAAANTPEPGIFGPGGGRIGALVLSRWTRPDTWSTTPYNHYSLLASVEDAFGLPHLGYARQHGLSRFGLDVYNSGWS